MSPQALTIPNADATRIRMVVLDFDGVFTDNTVWVTEDGKESVRCWRSDGLGLSKLKKAGILVWVLSTEVNPVVSQRCKKLQIPCIQGQENKGEALAKLAQEQGVPLNEILYMGNDINDLGCLESAGVSVIVQDAHPDVYAVADYRTKTPGGFGAVRELCDWLIACRKEAGLPTDQGLEKVPQ